MFNFMDKTNSDSTEKLTLENVNRRKFLQQIGLGSSAFVLGCVVPGFGTVQAAEGNHVTSVIDKAEHALNFFVGINTDGTASIVCHRAEMGQGIRTSIVQIIADELEADWDKVFMVQGKADKGYGGQGTAGSASIRMFYTKLRRIGASAKYMLERAAAEKWGVSPNQVFAKQHKVINKVTNQAIGYGELAELAAKQQAPELKTVPLKNPKDFKFIGQDVSLFDLDNIVSGTAVYAQDIQIEDMLIASIQRPPVVGGKVKSFDATDAMAVKGVVEVIRLRDRNLPTNILPLGGIAVIATNTWAAHEGKKKLKIEWDHGAHSAHNSTSYDKALVATVNNKGQVERQQGDVYSHQYSPSKTVEATYTMPYQSHSPMETPAATAWVKGDGEQLTCQIWAGTQHPQWAQNLVLTELGLKPKDADKVDFNMTLMGGAFGRKSKSDFVIEAVEISKQLKKPIKVVWSREDDIQHGFYHSTSANFMKAELTDTGSADYWIQRVAYPPIPWIFNDKNNRPDLNAISVGFVDTPFKLNNISLETQTAEGHVRIGWLRAVACLNNGFALGSFVDELAVKSNIDTQKMWLNLLGDDRNINPKQENWKYKNYSQSYETHPISVSRMKNCINTLCDKANVSQSVNDNEAWGIGFLRSFGAYVAAATKVRVEHNTVKILEMHTAIDCGVIISPDRVIAQMEGAMVFGLSIALMGDITVKDGKIEQSNFHDSPVTRMHQSPPMFVHLIESNEPPGGVGEPGVPPIIPSITNAIFHASGVRIRDLPINKHMTI